MSCERVDMGNGNFAIVCGVRRSKPAVHFPATTADLKAAGWRPQYSRDCRLCHTPLEFWITNKGKPMPIESVLRDGAWVLISHWESCVFADKFRKAKPKAPERPKTGDLFKEE
jgi:hypothetical protein